MKTNAARILDRLGIEYETRDYEVDLDALSAPAVAAKVDLPARQVFKTLLCQAPQSALIFAVVPGDAELDLKRLAQAAGVRKCAMVALASLRELTGYVRGGVTVLGAKKAGQVFIDASAEHHSRIAVSAGIRGQQLLLDPKDYARATRADFADIARQKVTNR